VSDAPKARDILAALFADVPGLVELRALDLAEPDPTRRIKGREFLPAAAGDAIAAFAREHDATRHNLYFGCATRTDASSGRADNCLTLPVLFADLDFKGDEARETAAGNALIQAPCPATLITATGGGFHAFWKLAAPLDLSPPEGREAAVVWLKRLAQALDADPACAEVARVLRVPHSTNYKYEPPRRVGVLQWKPDVVADLAAFDAWLPPLAEPVPLVSRPHAGAPADTSDLEQRARAYVAAMDPAVEGQHGDHQTYRVACVLVNDFALDNAAALSLLQEFNARCTPPWSERELVAKLAHARRYSNRPVGTKRDAPALPAETPDGAGPTFALTDLGNAEFFAAHVGERVRFDHRRRRWLVWNAPTWRPDADATVHRLAAAAVRRRYTEAGRLEDAAVKKHAATWAIKSESRDRLAALLTLAQTLEPVADAGDAWDVDPWLLACPNGVIDLRTGDLRAGRPDDRLTFRAGVAFDAAARAPRFERFVAEIVDGDTERVTWLHKAIGYALTGLTAEQVWFLLYGTGANGKGTFTRILSHVLGDYAFNLPFSTFEARPGGIPNDLAALAGRRFVTASETNDGTRLNEARIKALTGEDTLTARFLHGEFFSFVPVAKLWLSVNHKPVVKDQSHGFWRRVRLIPFERTFVIDKSLDAALRAEAAGVLAWAVRGCLRWQAEGLGDVPAAVREAVADYQAESDPLAEFLSEHTTRIDSATARASALFDRYVHWADRNGVKSGRLSSTGFGRALAERGYPKRHTNAGNVYLGLALKTAATEAA